MQSISLPQRLARGIYSLIFGCLLPVIILRLLAKSLKQPLYRQHLLERLGYGTRHSGHSIWIHAVSVGEMKVAVLLLERIRVDVPAIPVVLTCTTAAGRQLAEKHLRTAHRNIFIRYFPFDLAVCMRRFVRSVQPVMLLTMETELWPNLLHMLKQQDIPVLLLNARMSAPSMRSYIKWAMFTRTMFRSIAWVGAQYPLDRKRFIRLGVAADRVDLTGNIKIDASVASTDHQWAGELQTKIQQRPVWVAGSVRKGKEEDAVMQAHMHILQDMPDALLILVPRHPERTAKMVRKIKAYHLSYTLFSVTAADIAPAVQVLVVDAIGLLQGCYQVAQVAFVGGSIAKTGGQNILEPFLAGTPVIAGPHLYNFATLSRLLEQKGALTRLQEAALNQQIQELYTHLLYLLHHPDQAKQRADLGRDFIQSQKGSLERTLQKVREYLAQQHLMSTHV